MSVALVRAREAVLRHAWGDAYAAFAAAGSEETLEAEDLEAAALAAYLTGRDPECESLWAGAHRAWLERRDVHRAARCAFWLGLPLILKGETARGGGWLARGARLLDDQEPAGAECGLLLVPDGLRALRSGEPARALETFERVGEIGEAHADPDVVAFGRLGRGQALIALGQVPRGVSLLDEAMVAVIADDVSPIATGVVYCAVLHACQDTFDVARAQEWTAALARWCDQQQDLVPFRGDCLVHRAEILQVRGRWSAALNAAQQATEWLAGRPGAARAHYRVGELHRLRGETAAADRHYRAASAAGHSPQPGCALLRLAQGHAAAATAMIERALEAAHDSVARAAVLPAFVEIALATRAVAAARAAADELAELAADVDTSHLHGLAHHAAGAVLLAENEPRAAFAALQEGCLRWQEVAAPYELARTQVAAALACRALGDDDTAAMQLEAARGAFARLGAGPDLARVEDIAGRRTTATAAGLTARELEVLALVSRGHTNRDIAAALVISPHTARRHLQNIFRKLGVSSRAAATAFAFRHDLVENENVARMDH
jgi:DNA-binding CsgD family transcriptional regulator/tetratricopeptide (TPR) repeat protein